MNRDKLLKILHTLGLRKSVLNWFKSYLSSRRQKVKFQGSFLDEREINFGVPQGSKLSPILFNIHINEIISIIKSDCVDIKLFADDMIITVKGNDLDVIECILNECLKRLNNWLNGNQLKINEKKNSLYGIT